MKHLLKILPFSLVIALSSCTVKDDGNTASPSELVKTTDTINFPDFEKSYLDDFPRYDPNELTHVTRSIDDDTVRQLIGNPHFSEFISNNWNYVFNIRLPYSRDYIQCQLQLHFDEHNIVEDYYWNNPECASLIEASLKQPQPVALPASVRVAPPTKETINLGADALFDFNKWQPENMLSNGRTELDQLANKLKQYQSQGDTRIVITGHTDRKGDEMYNINLSQLRAQTVRSYLVKRGVNPSNMIAVGAGESQPVSECSTNLPLQQEIECLQPNRRVTIDVSVN